MKELKSYISEGFFSNIGANNIIKPVIDTIKDASINDKIDSSDKRHKFADLLTSILKDVESDIKKGKLVFEYIRNDSTNHIKTMISLEINGLNDARWSYVNQSASFGRSAFYIAASIAEDLYYEATHPIKESSLHHSIANTIKVTEFKVA